jgi:predicted nucleic acid-binding protein
VIVVDSSVWIDYFNGYDSPESQILESLLGVEIIVVGDLIVTEVLQGFTSDSDYKKAKLLLTSLIVVDMVGVRNAIQSARNYRILRKHGITIRKTIDLIIGTYCVENKLPLLFQDRDFLPMVEYFGLFSMSGGD